jgi:hypothetical protein
MVYNCSPIPKVFISTTSLSDSGTPKVFQLLFERTIAPRAPVAESLRNSLLDCFVFMAMEINILKNDFVFTDTEDKRQK